MAPEPMVKRVVWAFFKALRMTVRGETLSAPATRPLDVWITETLKRVESVYAAADAAGMDDRAREAFTLTIDHRPISMTTILATVQHHASEAYPYLLQHATEHSRTAILASNMDDHYRVACLQEAENLPQAAAFTQAIQALAAHLEAIPDESAPKNP